MIIKINPKNSTLNKNKIPAALQNAKIKNNTECTGFFDKRTKILLKTKKPVKKVCNTSIKK